MEVQLTVGKVLNPGFTRALARLAECRTLTEVDHKAVVKLVKEVVSVHQKAKQLNEAGENDKLHNYNFEILDCQDCTVSSGACTKADLSPTDTIALGEIVKGE
jgi:hypothetical protein